MSDSVTAGAARSTGCADVSSTPLHWPCRDLVGPHRLCRDLIAIGCAVASSVSRRWLPAGLPFAHCGRARRTCGTVVTRHLDRLGQLGVSAAATCAGPGACAGAASEPGPVRRSPDEREDTPGQQGFGESAGPLKPHCTSACTPALSSILCQSCVNVDSNASNTYTNGPTDTVEHKSADHHVNTQIWTPRVSLVPCHSGSAGRMRWSAQQQRLCSAHCTVARVA